MSIIELFILAIGLSMDAFAVSICKGLSLGNSKPKLKHYLLCGAWFGFFQALMPLIGFLLGSTFSKFISRFDHWVAFVLLAFLGIKMIKESFEKNENEDLDSSFSFKSMLILAVATSIDALAVGISFSLFTDFNLIYAISFIGIITFICSAIGVKIGNLFGLRYKSKAEFAGGLILLFLGIKILFQHIINHQ